MHQSPDKRRVRESFDRAATTYDGAALVQRRVCERLLEELAEPDRAPRAPLDAGCGTGFGSRLLRARWPDARITGVDFAPSMLALARRSADCCAGDIENLPFADASFDLWWSSLSIQWCDAAVVFREASRVLAPGGLIAVSTLGPDTFNELRQAFAGIDPHRHTLHFCAPESIGEALARAGFVDIDLRRETHTVHYPDLKTLLRAVKAIGAQNVGAGGRRAMMGRAAWQQLEEAYERHRQPAGLPASYDVILAYAMKKR
ncbi:MAG: biotin biosynthesis protein BioC [Proteobacteria bacterium]|nr:biotin biosynthesis protein BioC [Pseudomonadota bacterium]